MKIQRRTPPKKPLLIGLITLLIIALATAGYLWWRQSQTPAVQTAQVAPTNTVDYNPPTPDQQAAQDAQKDALVTRPSGDQPTTPSAAISITITRVNQAGAGQAINVRTIVDGTTSGTCDLIFTKGSTSFTKTFNVTQDVSSATCNGDVDASHFSESGEWRLNAIVKKGSDVSSPATWDLLVNK